MVFFSTINLKKNATSFKEKCYHALKHLKKKGITYEKCLVLHPKFPLIEQKTLKKFFRYLKDDIQTVFGITQIVNPKLNYTAKINSNSLLELKPLNKNSALLNRIVSFKTENFLKSRFFKFLAGREF